MHLSKPVACTTPRVNCNANSEFWVIMRCQHRFINCNKYTTPVGDADNGRSFTYVGSKGIWEIFVLSAKFCHKPKIVLKIKSVKKKKKEDSA